IAFFAQVVEEHLFHRKKLALQLKQSTAPEDLFWCTFANDAMNALGRFYHHGHDLSGKVERNLIHLADLGDGQMFSLQGVVENGAVEQVFQAGLEMAVEIGQHQDTLILLQDDVAVSFEDDAVHGEGTCLVGAQDVHGPEVLNRMQAL